MRQQPAVPPPARPAPAGTARRRGPRRLAEALAVALMLVGMAASVLASLAWSSSLERQSTRSLDSSTASAAGALALALARDASLTATARTLLQTTPGITDQQFADWFRLLQGRGGVPGSFALLDVEEVPRRTLPAFERAVRADPPLGRDPSTFALTPASAGPPYCLLRLGTVRLLPGLGVPPALFAGLSAFARPDLDYCGLPLGALLREAARTRQVAAFSLAGLAAQHGRPGGASRLASLAPVLARTGLVATVTPVLPPNLPAGHHPHGSVPPVSWVLGIYQSTEILQPVLAGHHGWSAVLSYVNPAGGAQLLARSGPVVSDGFTRTFHLAGAPRWVVRFTAPGGSGLSPRAQGALLLLLGLLLTSLLTLLLLTLSRSRSRALRLVEERTEQLRHRALHDSLTDLPNRSLIFDRAEQLLARAHRHRTQVVALFLDLDQFKDANDSFGHGAGDELIRQAGQRFAAVLRESDTVGRLGGDEFVVLFEDEIASPGAEAVARKLIACLRTPFVLGAQERAVTVSASIGIAAGLGGSAEELLSDADIALYEAKSSARGGYVTFRPEMRDSVAGRLRLEAELRTAVAEQQFFLLYQPTVDLADQRITGAEALLRWRHPERGTVLPGEFVAALESTGMIAEVGREVLHQACRQAVAWRRLQPDLRVSVNVSARQLEREEFVGEVRQALQAAGLVPDALILEITETTLMRDSELSTTRLRALRALGVNLAIDDFGTGYCSLAYLQQFPVASLKIDRSFVARLDSSTDGQALVQMIIRLGRQLRLGTLAEGIETQSQLDRLLAEECGSGQGYLFSRPLPAGDLERRLAEQVARASSAPAGV